jgi:hypothetical protein
MYFNSYNFNFTLKLKTDILSIQLSKKNITKASFTNPLAYALVVPCMVKQLMVANPTPLDLRDNFQLLMLLHVET